ncbi:Glycosyltransferase AER61 [Macleaya cordata]|uniref:Glycosyltransferase AER61 n=1 Tax=Macleaya cordata TaxID=56857 RepID=A0A200QXT5_MACCD|nr:Glycosyltransferase AER61 [Macleaya cordata]
MVTKLRDSVTFLPLKDLRFAETALQGHTWFMSSMHDTHEEGEVQYQHYPSNSSKGRLLCIKGRDNHDGAWNSYAFAYPDALPENATLLRGLTFVSYNHYNYDNIWHGLSAVVPFVGWHRRVGECAVPTRWVLYHWGELRSKMGVWLQTLMEATFGGGGGGGGIKIETFEGMMNEDYEVACFEEAVVMRHNEGGMSRERRIEVYDLLRCKARVFCNVSMEGRGANIGLTMFMRTGARSFRNPTVVIEIFERECAKVEGCRVKVAYSNNLTFCEQVSLMSYTDILVSPHGAQLTNMFFMDKNSSVMEFFPKGWLKLAGVGQYVYHWIASWSGMRHQGAWRDPNPDPDPNQQCQYPEDDRRCFTIYKSSKIGHNETFFAKWVRNVLNEVKKNKQEQKQSQKTPAETKLQQLQLSGCACG